MSFYWAIRIKTYNKFKKKYYTKNNSAAYFINITTYKFKNSTKQW